MLSDLSYNYTIIKSTAQILIRITDEANSEVKAKELHSFGLEAAEKCFRDGKG